jgi:hypothetical protein
LPSSPVQAAEEKVEAAPSVPVAEEVAPTVQIPIPASEPGAPPSAAETFIEPVGEAVEAKWEQAVPADRAPTRIIPAAERVQATESVATEPATPKDAYDEPAFRRRASAKSGDLKKASGLAPVAKGNTQPAPHHVVLSYVYEVDAVELPAAESQWAAEDEPIITVSADGSDALDDDPMPFEARPAGTRKSEVWSPESGVAMNHSEVEKEQEPNPGDH